MSAALQSMIGGAMGGGQKQPVQRYVFDNFALGIDQNRNASPPRDGTLYDIVNGYLTPGHTIARRSGFTKSQALSAFGIVSWQGKLHTFFTGVDPGSNGLVQTHALVCADGSGSALAKVHFAAPLLGFLYVVAEFANGKIYHYYLDSGGAEAPKWQANAQYNYGAIVSPSTLKGLRFWCTTNNNEPAWAPSTAVAVNTVVQPSTAKEGFVYKCTALSGPAGFANFVTGQTEPAWPRVVGATVVEDVEFTKTVTKKWQTGLHVASGEVMIPPRFREAPYIGLHLRASYSGETSRNVNMTGNYEPNWPTVAGDSVVDGDVTWTVEQHTTITWTCEAGNLTGGAEPAWPAAIGGTVVDNGITWKAIADNIQDTACPNTKIVAMAASQIWAQSADGSQVAHCAAGNPRAWSTDDPNVSTVQPDTSYGVGDRVVDPYGNAQVCVSATTTGDAVSPLWPTVPGVTVAGNAYWEWEGVAAGSAAGFLDTGLQSTGGDTTLTALGVYRGSLAVFTASGFQVWQVDQDPTQNAILDAFEGAGCVYPRTCAELSNDLNFTSSAGVRSLSTVIATGELQPGDSGMPIDKLVQPNLSSADLFTPMGLEVAGYGQYWFINGANVYVLVNYPEQQIKGWSRYTLPWSIEYATILNGVVYVLASDGNLYYFNYQGSYEDQTAGAPVVYTTSIIFPYMVLGRHTMFQPEATAGYAKLIRGVDVISSAQCTFEGGYDETNLASLTPAVSVGPDDRQGGIIPVECMCDSFSPQVSYAANAAFELMSVTVWYDVLSQAVG